MQEEVNVEIGKPHYLLDLTFIRLTGSVLVLSYYAVCFWEVKLDADAVEYRWATLAEAKELDLISVSEEIEMVDVLLPPLTPCGAIFMRDFDSGNTHCRTVFIGQFSAGVSYQGRIWRCVPRISMRQLTRHGEGLGGRASIERLRHALSLKKIANRVLDEGYARFSRHVLVRR